MKTDSMQPTSEPNTMSTQGANRGREVGNAKAMQLMELELSALRDEHRALLEDSKHKVVRARAARSD